jgi:hypothetical protein
VDIQASRDRIAVSKGEIEMSKNQEQVMLKVRRALNLNHNESALKVRQSLRLKGSLLLLALALGTNVGIQPSFRMIVPDAPEVFRMVVPDAPDIVPDSPDVVPDSPE